MSGVVGGGVEDSAYWFAISTLALHLEHPHFFCEHGWARSGIKFANLASTELATLLITSSSPLSSQFFREHLQALESQASTPQLWAFATELTLRRQAVSRPILNCVFFMRVYLCGPCDGT